MQDLKISIIGLGASEAAQLSDSAMTTLLSVQMVLGSKRQLKVVEHLIKEQQVTPLLPKLDVLQSVLEQYYNQGMRSIAVLASGDPLYYGIGSWFSRHYSAHKLDFYPAVSSVQEVCHRLGLSLQDTPVLSLHGRPMGKIRSKLREDQTLLILTDSQSTPQILASELIDAGYYQAEITVCEAIGYRYEEISTFAVKDLIRNPKEFDPLHISVLKTGKSVKPLPLFPGFADHHFITEGKNGGKMISKAQVRLAVLSMLQAKAGDVIYDIGAGCGSVSVELNYWCEEARVFAIEKNEERYQCLLKNQKKFGVVTNLHPVKGSAPGILVQLPKPNKIFIGGSDGMLPQLLERLWAQLDVGGQIVATAVLEKTKHQLLDFLSARKALADASIESLQIAISNADYLADSIVYRQALPVSVFNFTKISDTPAIDLSKAVKGVL